ncbi:matrixin family metalloprotease [Hymenobacter norwichensis]|uniref:matrixin family metalloprotease n=1 Tax=Hymenobacter norwichensis TaxID=223903 RepID=UPI000524AA16|nr:matrixin family metalloprotease [Hymenobacter norwichensis]
MLLRFTALCLFGLLLGDAAQAQISAAPAETHCLVVPLDPAQRSSQATLVVEATVLNSRSFWDARHQRIYTAHRVQVFSSFKGQAPTELTVLTEGGTVDLTRHELTNTLTLQPGQQGVLFLVPATFPGTESAGPAWMAYGSQQGLIGYDLATGMAADLFRQYGTVSSSFYQSLTTLTSEPRRIVQPNPVLAAALKQQESPILARGTAPVVSTLSPASIPAGTGAVLTISGSGFGATRGTGFVEFRNADNGGSSLVKPQDSDYVSWTDARIQVRVPSLGQGVNGALSPAGSGQVRVTTADQLAATSSAAITVPYAISNVQLNGTNQILRPSPINQNGRGGYTFRFEASFASNTAAVTAFRNALATWRCQSAMNWDLDAIPRTSRGSKEDGENSIGFDYAESELPANVLGRTTSYYRGCFQPGGGVAFAVQEIDMQFDDATTWQFGPLPAVSPQLDFESVAVHELGHAQQLAHVILPRAVMHYAVARGQTSRAINQDDVTGGRLVLRTRGFVPQGCGSGPMLPAPLTGLAAITTTAGIDLTWTTQDECFLDNFVVERSLAPDTSAWQTLATVPRATGNAYRYLDAQPQPGLRYYRLRLRRPATSFGPASLDTTVPVLAQADAATALLPQLFPNPADDTGLTLQYPATANGRLIVSVVDAIGRRHSIIGLEFLSGLNLLRVPTASLRPGWYILRFRVPGGRETNLPFVRR